MPLRQSYVLYLPVLFLLLGFAANIHAEPLKAKPEPTAGLHHPARVIKAPEPSAEKPFAEHFAVFHISSGDGYAQRLVLNNAQNMQAYYGPDKVDIEIVAYGPGLRTLFKENTNSKRIASMKASGIKFSACSATMKKMGRDKKSLHSDADVVAGGVIRIMELQEAGWTYIRP